MGEILSYSFFQYALAGGILVSLISGTLGSLVVLRREPNVTHAIANILFLGIVVSLFSAYTNHIGYSILFSIIAVGALMLLEKFSHTSRESSKEILGHLGLASGIFLIGIMGNLQIDVANFLFGNILFVNLTDIILLSTLLLIGAGLWILFGKKFLRVTLSPEISKSQGIRTHAYEFGYLLYLALFIALSVKIFGILLLSAFLVLPANIAKNICAGLYKVFIIASILSIISVTLGLFVSYFFDTSAGATSILILGLLFFISIFIKKD